MAEAQPNWRVLDGKGRFAPTIPSYQCEHCKQWFRPKRKDRTRFCSRKCSFEHFKAPPLPEPRACNVCGRPCPNRRMYQCSDECRRELARRKSAAYWHSVRGPFLRVKLQPRPCSFCGLQFQPKHGGQTKFCSRRCIARDAKRRYGTSARKRARWHGVEYEPVDRIKVFERDGWRCQVCGRKTPRAWIGSNRPQAPELDHRIPMALGGSHSYANTQCCCRRCNNVKGGARSIGQISIEFR